MYRTGISVALSQEAALWATMYTEESVASGQRGRCPWVGSSSQKQIDVMEPVTTGARMSGTWV